MGRLNEQRLIEITRQEVKKYAGISPHAKAYFIADDVQHIYLVTGVENQPGPNSSWIIVQAHIKDDEVVIDVDNVWDKQLWKALEQVGIPREQIVLAYKGEELPEGSGV
jgi:hypothetical protein